MKPGDLVKWSQYEPGYFGLITLTGMLLEIVDRTEVDDHELFCAKVLCSWNGRITTLTHTSLEVLS